MRYAWARVLHGLFLLAGVSVLTFALAGFAPGDYFSELAANPTVSSATVDAFRARAGLDRTFAVRYAGWVASMARGDFGQSVVYNGPVGPLLWERARNTLLLTGTAALFAWLLAVPLGVWSAASAASWPARLVALVWAFLLAVPDLLLAIILLVFGARTGWFPTGGMRTPGKSAGADLAWHLALPVLVLLAGMLPVLVRHVRAAMIGALDSPYGWNARAQGIPRRRLLFRHLLPAAANPLVSLLGLSIGTLLSTSLLVEVVMGWPGLGPLLLDAIMNRDLPVVLGVVMASAAFLIAGNLVADLLLYRLDPRIRAGGPASSSTSG